MIANFVAEDFRRFRDSSALGSAIAGELLSYRVATQDLTQSITLLAEQAEAGNTIRVAEIKMPRDLVYESAVTKISLLGAEIPESVALAYGRIRAFRTLYMIIAGDKVRIDAATFGRLYRQLLLKLAEAETEGLRTVALLHARVGESFCLALLTALINGRCRARTSGSSVIQSGSRS